MQRLLERTFLVEATAERAWAELVAAQQWPRWARHLRRVEVTPPGPVGPGSSATLKLSNHTTATVKVTEFQDGRRFRWEGSFLWLGLGYDHLITTDEAGQVHITFTVEGGGVGVNTIGPLFARIYARNLDRAIPRLQALLRQPQPERSPQMTGNPNLPADVDVDLTRLFNAPRELVYQAFIDPDQLARWYGPVGFSVPRDTVEVQARVGGHLRLVMVSDADPDLRSAVDLRFTEVVENELLVGLEAWEGIPGQSGTWLSRRRVEFYDEGGGTRLVLREGPHPAGMAEGGRQAWQSMLTKLDTMLQGLRRPA
jgi:uncharacterized protein YndB with AHSA1/START domain